jgi:hypothetical protein
MNPLALIQVILSRNTGIARPAIRRMTSEEKEHDRVDLCAA